MAELHNQKATFVTQVEGKDIRHKGIHTVTPRDSLVVATVRAICCTTCGTQAAVRCVRPNVTRARLFNRRVRLKENWRSLVGRFTYSTKEEH